MIDNGAKLPDFIIAGAPRSGTTWLWQLLDRHPQIYMAKPAAPEPKFFLVDELFERGPNYYSDTWFKETGSATIYGEKSTNYLESPVVASRIKKILPDVKILFALREPVERAFSNYLWSRSNGLETESFETALELEDERERTLPVSKRFSRPHAYFSRGLYADLLQPFLQNFERNQILCLRHDSIASAPRDVAERVHQFLGVSPRPIDADGLGKVRATARGPTDQVAPALRKKLALRYIDANRRLASLFGPDFEIWNEYALNN